MKPGDTSQLDAWWVGEQPIRLIDVPKYVPPQPNGKRLHKSAPYRWTLVGVRGVRLESFEAPAGRCTTIEAVHRFLARVTVASHSSGSDPNLARRLRERGLL